MAKFPESEPPASLQGLTVLAVDDGPDTLELVRRIVEDRGATVLLAQSAAAALDLLAHQPVDVLVGDIGMREMDGYELMRRLRASAPALNADVLAIALTAFARPEDRRQALAVGYQEHLAKPFDADTLVAIVARLAGKAGATGRGKAETSG